MSERIRGACVMRYTNRRILYSTLLYKERVSENLNIHGQRIVSYNYQHVPVLYI